VNSIEPLPQRHQLGFKAANNAVRAPNALFQTHVRERTIPTDRPPLVGEVSTNFYGQKVSRGQLNPSPRPYSRFSRPEPLVFL
jgi:hypothetical protein